jgi:glycosyltransferase involved in cell wall biosynthesis
MRLLFVVQRYGREVVGGAEQHCREFATRLAERGHEVEVLSSCAISHVSWANAYSPGTHVIDGVQVHRLPVAWERDGRLFTPLDSRTVWMPGAVPLYLQRDWIRALGPYLPDLPEWLSERAASFDVVIFFTYLYYTTWRGLPVASAFAPTILHPTAHDEPYLYLSLFDATFWTPSAFAFSTEEEASLVRRRFGLRPLSSVIGIGVDLDSGGDPGSFRLAYGIEDRPYLVFVGRVIPEKGAHELLDFFVAYKKRNPSDLALVMVGELEGDPPLHSDVVFTGVVDDAIKRSALAGSLAVVVPSYFESFSMVLTEAWSQRKPALVQGYCDVLEGQAKRAGGGIPYRGFAEFEAALDWFVEDSQLRLSLGGAGRSYVEQNYDWEFVLDRYERLLRILRRSTDLSAAFPVSSEYPSSTPRS